MQHRQILVKSRTGASPQTLVGVDGFDQDERRCKGDEGREVSLCFLAPQGDPLETFQLSDGLFDAGTPPVERFGKNFGDNRSFFALAPRAGRQARKASGVVRQSSSVIFKDTANTPNFVGFL